MTSGSGRYAPSPTGDLHLGNLRTAVLAWLFARSSDRKFLLRIDDLDFGRVRPGIADRQHNDLVSLGLDFDQPTLVQSKRAGRYRAALDQLAGQGLIYECFCTRREIAEAASAPHRTAGRYPGNCRELTARERGQRRAEGRPPALRIRADDATITITDLLHGAVSETADDVVVRRNDGAAGYHLATVVDDAESGVDQVVRGADLLSSAPTQAWLATQLGLAVPTYAHVPLVLNAAGRRLAKRDGAVTLADLARLGWTPAQVLGRLAQSLGLAGSTGNVSVADLRDRFDPAQLPPDPWRLPADAFHSRR